jgi:peptide/nickel transport system permease protein
MATQDKNVMAEGGTGENAAPPTGARGDGIAREGFRLSAAGKLGAGMVGFWILIALTGPMLAPYGEAEFVSYDPYLPMFSEFVFGTDYLGRDLFSRVLYGTRLTLFMAVTATLIASSVGTVLGMISVIRGGWVDMLLSRLNDALLSFPTIMMGLVVIAALGSSIPVLIVMTGLIYASSVFRIARALAADQKVMDYVEVAQGRGEGLLWILFHEILPNIIVPLVVDFGIRLSFAILFMSGLSFLGLGVQPPQADWGSLVRENLTGLTSESYAPIIPAIAIATLSIGLNLIVDDFSARSGKDMAEKLK